MLGRKAEKDGEKVSSAIRNIWGGALALPEHPRRLRLFDLVLCAGMIGVFLGLFSLAREATGQLRPAVALTKVGMKFVTAGHEERKVLWREQLLKLRLFRDIYQSLKDQPAHLLSAGDVREKIAASMPQESDKRVFDTLIRWGRYGSLFLYKHESQRRLLTKELG